MKKYKAKLSVCLLLLAIVYNFNGCSFDNYIKYYDDGGNEFKIDVPADLGGITGYCWEDNQLVITFDDGTRITNEEKKENASKFWQKVDDFFNNIGQN